MSVLETVDFGRTVLESLGYTVRGNRVFLISSDGEEEVVYGGLSSWRWLPSYIGK